METLKHLFTDVRLFKAFCPEHFIWLAFGILYIGYWIWLGKKQTTEAGQQKIGVLFSSIAIVTWIIFTAIHIAWDDSYDVQTDKYPLGFSLGIALPLHLCYFLNIILIFMHQYRSKWLFDSWYPWLLAACAQALFTADLDEAFPHYFNIRYFIVHITLVLHALYAATIYKFRPDYLTPIRALAIGLAYMGALHLLNLWLGTNFMYTVNVPKGTILEALGENWFIKALPLALFMFYVVCSPFYFRKKKLEN
jgi:hypothetical integral membrane protein (TIGR02206 family)